MAADERLPPDLTNDIRRAPAYFAHQLGLIAAGDRPHHSTCNSLKRRQLVYRDAQQGWCLTSLGVAALGYARRKVT